jgi:hypothetical protein
MADPLQNPYLQQGLLQMQQPNPYIDAKFQGKPLQLPGFYTGDAGNAPPTNAMGNPIQSFVDYNNDAQAQYQKDLAAYNASNPSGQSQGTTLNSTPQQFADLQEQVNMNTINAANATQTNNTGTFGNVNTGIANYPGAVDAIIADSKYRSDANQAYAAGQPIGMPQAQPSSSSQGQPPSPPDLRQAYLNALANPGKVTTPGATVAASQPLGQPSVMDAFLAKNSGGGGQGAGNYNNSGFFNTLNQLQKATV